MDRLVCGDVGFGKTEVAVRAAFKAVADSKQVAVLVPTTILALQHFETFKNRLKDLPCNIDYVSRLRTAKEIAEREGVDVRLYRVIYNAIEDVQAAMKGMLDPVFEEQVLGHAEVRQTFKASGVGTIAGSYVLDGMFERNCSTRIVRDGIVIYDGALASLKRFKDDVKEVKAGYECGFVFDKFNDIKEGDQVEAYKMVEIPR